MSTIQAENQVHARRGAIEGQPALDQIVMSKLPSGYLPPSLVRKALSDLLQITPSLIHRWCERGTRGVILESSFIGGRRMLTREGLAAFFRELNTPKTIPAAPNRSPAVRGRDHAKAEAELDRLLG